MKKSMITVTAIALMAISATAFAQQDSTKISGEYRSDKSSYQFNSGNKVVFTNFSSKQRFVGSYTINALNSNDLKVVIDSAENKKAFLEYKRKGLKEKIDAKQKSLDPKNDAVYQALCMTGISQGADKFFRKYNISETGIKQCTVDIKKNPDVKDIMSMYKQQINNEIKQLTAQMNAMKYEDEFEEFWGIKNPYFIFSISKNSIHILDEECASMWTFTKSGSTESTPVDKSQQFCFDKYDDKHEGDPKWLFSKVYDKCDGEEYDPETESCQNNAIHTKCGETWYNLNEKYCIGGVLKNKIEFTDSRDGKKYKAVPMGNKTWMAENLNFETKGGICYKGEAKNCEKYGRFYKNDVEKNNLCPAGWRIPKGDEKDNDYKGDFSYISNIDEADKMIEDTKKKINAAMEARGENVRTEEENNMLSDVEENAKKLKMKIEKERIDALNFKREGGHWYGAFEGIGEKKFYSYWLYNNAVASYHFNRFTGASSWSSNYQPPGNYYPIRCVKDGILTEEKKAEPKPVAKKEEVKKKEEPKPVAKEEAKKEEPKPAAKEEVKKEEAPPAEKEVKAPALNEQKANVEKNKIDPQIETKRSNSFWVAVALDVVGAGLIAYGVLKNSDVAANYDLYKAAQTPEEANSARDAGKDTEKLRDRAYMVGAISLTAGIGVHIWF